MLNKQLLLAQKQGLQDGEFLVTIEKKSVSGITMDVGYHKGRFGKILPDVLNFGNKEVFITSFAVDSRASEGPSLWPIGLAEGTRVRVTYRNFKPIVGTISNVEKLIVTIFDGGQADTLKAITLDMCANVGKSVRVRLELL